MTEYCSTLQFASVLLIGFLSTCSHASTLDVPSEQYPTIQSAINAAASGDIVRVAAGTYNEQIELKNGINVIGAGADKTIINGEEISTVVTSVGVTDMLLEGFTVTNGKSADSGGILCQNSSIAINDCFIKDNSGAGISCHGSNLSISNCRITQNAKGGIFCNTALKIIVRNSFIANNIAGVNGSGAGIRCGDNLDPDSVIENCIIAYNIADLGGGIYCSGPVRIINCTIAYNSATQGGGVWANPAVPPLINNCIIWANGESNLCNCIATYSDVEYDSGGAGNISAEPEFVAPEYMNFRLNSISPCIDAGTRVDSSPNDFETEIRTNPDMGADEFADTDEDGMQNRWELDNGLDPTDPADRDADPDVDGFSDYQEYIRTSDPYDGTVPKENIYVDQANNSGIEDGTQSHPYNTIQEAIDAAFYNVNSNVFVGRGRYQENICVRSKVNLESILPDGAVIEGRVCFRGSLTGGKIEGITIENDGITADFSSPEILRCTTPKIHCRYSAAPTISNSIIKNSDIGLYLFKNCSPTITDTIVQGHSLAGIRLYENCSPIIKNCIIRSNTSSNNKGAGVYCYESNPVIINSIIDNNSATSTTGNGYGGAISCEDSEPIVINCTIVDNFAAEGAGGIDGSPAMTIVNCIIWGNGDDLHNCTATYSNIEDGDGGEGNISSAPMFINPESGNYHLKSGSPCIDVGKNDVPQLSDEDIDGDQRILFGRIAEVVDIGADEFNPERPIAIVTTPSETQSAQITMTHKLYDQQFDMCSIQVQFSDDNGLSWHTATMGTGGDGLLNLTSSPSGVTHSYQWDSVEDIGYTIQNTMRIRIVPSDIAVGIGDSTANFTVDNAIDTDADNLPDLWEEKYFADLCHDAEGDDDLNSGDPAPDGKTNYEEYVAGTDPTDPTSLLQLLAVSMESADVKLKWSSVPGKQYAVYYSDDMIDWTIVNPVIYSQESVTQWIDRAASIGIRRFYKVQVLP